MTTTPEVRTPAVRSDKRGAHIKLLGESPAQVALPALAVAEVFYTLNEKDALRGMHLQVGPPQPKLVTCVTGEFIAYTLCLREGADYLRRERQLMVAPERRAQVEGAVDSLWVPEGWALGYRSLRHNSRMLYLAGSPFSPQGSRGVHPFSPLLNLDWRAPGETYSAFTREQAILSPADDEQADELRL